jgi:hypothetical protein
VKRKSGYCQCLIDDAVVQKTSTDHSITHVLLNTECRGRRRTIGVRGETAPGGTMKGGGRTKLCGKIKA